MPEVRGDPVSRLHVDVSATVYQSGELSISKRTRNSSSRPPEPRYGPRYVTGASPAGARIIRRAVVGRAGSGRAAFKMLTLTSATVRSDEEMRAALATFLQAMRDSWRGWDGWYLWAAELHQRGVLHFHVLVAERIPRPVFARLRALWAESYGMGAVSVDIKHMRSPKGAAKYLSKYLTKKPRTQTVGLDPDGHLTFRPWPVSRHNGQPYVRSRFRGNPYGMSQAARGGTAVRTALHAPLEAFAGLLSWHGRSLFFDSPADAESWLAAVVNGEQPPPPPRPQRERRPHGTASNGKRSAPEGAQRSASEVRPRV